MKPDLVAAVLVLAGAAALLFFGGLPSLQRGDTEFNAGFWPTTMLCILILLAAGLCVHAIRQPRGATQPEPRRPTAGMLRNMAAVVAFVPALLVFGFYPSALAYCAILPRVLGGVRWRASLTFALVFLGVLYLVFSIALRMDVPRGWLGGWLQGQGS